MEDQIVAKCRGIVRSVLLEDHHGVREFHNSLLTWFRRRQEKRLNGVPKKRREEHIATSCGPKEREIQNTTKAWNAYFVRGWIRRSRQSCNDLEATEQFAGTRVDLLILCGKGTRDLALRPTGQASPTKNSALDIFLRLETGVAAKGLSKLTQRNVPVKRTTPWGRG